MFKLRIKDEFVENRAGKSKSGKDYSLNTQVNCFLEINGETRRYPQVLQNGQKPYVPGLYAFDADALLTLNSYNALVVAPFATPTLKRIGD
jgi:hypothetical protein